MKNHFSKQNLFAIFLFAIFPFFVSGCAKLQWFDVNKITAEEKVEVLPGQIALIESDIIVNQPLNEDTVSSPVKISGKAMVSGAEVYFRIIDNWDNLIATSSVKLSQGESNYDLMISFPTPFTDRGSVQAFLLSDDGKTEKSLLQIPVRFKDFKKPLAVLYYSNILKDPKLDKCDEVYPLEKEIVIKNDIISSVLSALFSELSEKEMTDGFVNNLPEGQVKLNKIDYKDKTAILDFSKELLAGVDNDCRKKAIAAQIRQTLKNFKDVEEVRITVEGKDLK